MTKGCQFAGEQRPVEILPHEPVPFRIGNHLLEHKIGLDIFKRILRVASRSVFRWASLSAQNSFRIVAELA
jgi:hypothetical protein